MGLQDLRPTVTEEISLSNSTVSSLKRPSCSDFDFDDAVRVLSNRVKRQRIDDCLDHLLTMEEGDLIRELDDLFDYVGTTRSTAKDMIAGMMMILWDWTTTFFSEYM